MLPREKKILINVAGFGMGLLWVLKDELKEQTIPKANHFGIDEFKEWNDRTGPTGRWAVTEEELNKMNSRINLDVKEVKTSNSTW